ncbi:MAG: PQQ-dependent sugar dehydrogenase, partial [Chromatiaceae bacterium]
MYQIAKDFRLPSTSADRSIAGDANRIARARGRLDGQAPRDTRVIFQVADPKSDDQQFGSRMLWLPDKSLRISIGDG